MHTFFDTAQKTFNRTKFLEALEISGSISEACQKIGIIKDVVREFRRKYPDFDSDIEDILFYKRQEERRGEQKERMREMAIPHYGASMYFLLKNR